MFYGVSTLFRPFNAELTHFDKFHTMELEYKYSFVYQRIQFSLSIFFAQLYEKTVNFKLFSFAWLQLSSIWPMGRTCQKLPFRGQNGPGSDGSEGVLRIP